MTEIHQLGPVIVSHAFNADRSKVAVAENSNELKVYETRGYKLEVTLPDHDKLITSVDWAPRSNRIVTCSQDRNAYVWNLSQDGIWKPTLVLLRLNRSATVVKWSPNETKFAVGSGARTVAVCTFDEESDWWIAKHLKRPIRSTVLSLDWHPNGVLLAAGSADSQARVFSAFIKDVEEKPSPSVWGSRLPWNTVCGEFASPAGGWVHAVAFSPSGDCLAFAGHDSTINIVYPTGPEEPLQAFITIRTNSLPYMSLLFTAEDQLIAAGHDCQPVLFKGSPAGWQYDHSLDDPSNRAASATGSRVTSGGIGRLNNEAFNRFKAADSRGVGAVPSNLVSGSASPPGSPTTASGAKFGATSASTERMTVHLNTITCLRPYSKSKISTSGLDGKLVLWPL